MKWVKINEVRYNDKNPRVIRDDKFAKLKRSIIEFPEMLEKRPLVCVTRDDGKLMVLGGNMRLKALNDIGAAEVPVILADDWTEEQRARFLIADNVGFGEWDWDELANEWNADDLEKWGLDLPEIKVEAEAEEDNYEMPDEVQTDIVMGDLFEIGEHRLLCGDSTDSDQVARLMNGQKADMVFTDPPYGMFLDTNYAVTEKVKGKKYDKVIGDNKDFTPELINTIFACFDYCKEIFIWGADYFAELIPEKNEGSWVVWDKKIESLDKSIGSSFELCWSKQKHKREIVRILWNGFTAKEKNEKRVHPTQKPLKLVEFFLNNWGNETKLIADLFLGSGTTMVASHQLKRKCYGIELDPKYCQVIIDRMLKLDPTLEVKRNGQTYNRNTTDG